MAPIEVEGTSAGGPGGQPVFAYGSLMYPQVWERVVLGRYPASGATLRGFSRRRIAGETHPALVRGPPEGVVHGVLYTGVSDADLATLDRFEAEGEAYSRIRVAVEPGGGGRVDAWTYLYLLADRVAPDPWDPERFAERDLARFLAAYVQERATRPPTGG